MELILFMVIKNDKVNKDRGEFFMEQVHLDYRLEAVTELVPENTRVADIGTDHGYLLIYLCQKGKILEGIGCDLREGPLSSAKLNVRLSGVENKIQLRLGDGLKAISPNEVDGATICGMGGGTIREILEGNEELWKSLSYIVCQPQNDGGQLRKFLCESGWKIDEERIVESQNRIYEMFRAIPGEMKFPEKEIYWELGPLLIEQKEQLVLKKIEELLFLVAQALKGLGKSAKSRENEEKKELWKARKKELEEVKKLLLE